jgi:hypothetical protein
MKFAPTLCELGAAMPEVLYNVDGHSGEATALESMRHAACTTAREALDGPPPALVHPSRLPGASLLYSSQCASPLEEGPYREASMDEICAVRDGQAVGACTMDVCKGQSRPAVLHTVPEAGGMLLRIEVYDAPLAAMEVELFLPSRFASPFEQKWLTPDEAAFAKDLRAQVGAYVRRRGFERTPPRMHSRQMCIMRPGALPLLRLRQPQSAHEADEVRALLERTVRPRGGLGSLKALLDALTAGDCVRVETVFYQTAADEKPEPPEDCSEVASNSVLGPLALLVLKHLKDEDYYGAETSHVSLLEDEGEEGEEDGAGLEGLGGEGSALASAAKRRRVEALRAVDDEEVNTIATSSALEAEHVALAVRGSRVLMQLTGATQRVCGLKLVARSSAMQQLSTSLVEAFFCPSDARLLRGLLDGTEAHAKASCRALAAFLARSGEPRHAILLLTKQADGTLSSCCLFSHNGDWEVPFDSVTRYLLFPWALPLVLDGDTVHTINVHGVAREQFALTAAVRDSAAVGALPEEVVRFISEAREGLDALASVCLRLDGVERALQAPHVVAAAVQSAPSPDSDVTRGFKRIRAHLEAYDSLFES